MLGCGILTKNDSWRIRRVLDSIVSFVDEIVVVDDFSDDDTPLICESYGVKVFQRKLNNDFGKQYEFLFSKIESRWMFLLDCDMVVPRNTFKEIFRVLKEIPENVSALKLRIVDVIMGKKLEALSYSNWQMRVFRNKEVRVDGIVHSHFEVDGDILSIDCGILHYPMPSFDFLIRKWLWYTELECKKMNLEQLDVREVKKKIIRQGIKCFWKRFVKKGGWRDGFEGFLWCLITAMGEEMKWIGILDEVMKSREMAK